jgi:hypothetical protein
MPEPDLSIYETDNKEGEDTDDEEPEQA